MGKVTLLRSDIYTFMFGFSISYIISMIINFIFDRNGRVFPKISQKKLIPTLTGTFLMEIGVLFLYLAFSVGKASLVSPISSSYMALTLILAFIILREKLTKNQLLGVILAAMGIILIGI